jgi:hypothetical protein
MPYHGKLWWIGLSGFAGFLIGVIRYGLQYPDNLSGFFKVVDDLYVKPEWAPVTFFLSLISIIAGANLGPEVALVRMNPMSHSLLCNAFLI